MVERSCSVAMKLVIRLLELDELVDILVEMSYPLTMKFFTLSLKKAFLLVNMRWVDYNHQLRVHLYSAYDKITAVKQVQGWITRSS